MAVKKNVVTEGGNSVFFPTVVVVDSHGNPLSVTDDGELWITETEREYGVWAAITGVQNTATTTWYGLIDLSDTVNFPHETTGRLDFSFVRLSVDKAGAARGSISFCIVTRIDGTNADLVCFANGNFTQNDTGAIEVNANLAPHQVKTNVENQRLARFKTNAVLLNQTAINTGVTLTGPGTNFTPAVGDCIVRVVTTTGGDLAFVAAVNYHAHP